MSGHNQTTRRHRSNCTKQATQVEIAKLLNCSFSTVSRAFNQPDKVDPKTRELIFKTARSHGYELNHLASSLVKRSTRILGLVLCGSQNGFFGQVAFGAQQAAFDQGYYLLMADSNFQEDIEINSLRSMLQVRVAGIILQPIPKHNSEDLPIAFRRQDIKIVCLNSSSFAVCDSFISTNAEKGAFTLVEYLIDLGHSKIAHITGPLDEESAQDRLRGYKQALLAHDIPISDELIAYAPAYSEFSAIDGLLDSILPHAPTAIFAANDHIAMMTIKHLQARGVHVPGDISVAGYSNMPEAIYSPVPLTTMDQFPERIGRVAVHRLITLITGKKHVEKVTLLDDELVVRASTAPPGG